MMQPTNDRAIGASMSQETAHSYTLRLREADSEGARLRFQMHYTPNGTATEDSTRIGLVFAKEEPKHEVRVAGVVNAGFRIPPGADNHQVVASIKSVPTDIQILAFLPHMHLRGKAARYDLISGGETRTMLDIPRYDFNWQLLYRYAEPVSVKAGDTLRFTAWYDNSSGNPANPDPNKEVRWGPQTQDEMHLGYVEYIVPGSKPGDPIRYRHEVAHAEQFGTSSVVQVRQNRMLATRYFNNLTLTETATCPAMKSRRSTATTQRRRPRSSIDLTRTRTVS